MTSDPQQDLAYIRQVMEQTRRRTLISGDHLVAWGLLVSLGLVCDGLTSAHWVELPVSAIWLGIVVVGWAYSVWRGRRSAGADAAYGYAARLVDWLWIACGISMTIALIVGPVTGALPGAASGGLGALFIGIGVFMTGQLAGMAWLRNLAVGWWLGAVAMFVWHGPAGLWICAGLFLALLVAPGLVLNRQNKAAAEAGR